MEKTNKNHKKQYIALACVSIALVSVMIVAGVFLFGANQRYRLNRFEIVVGDRTHTITVNQVESFEPTQDVYAIMIALNMIEESGLLYIDHMRVSGGELTIHLCQEEFDGYYFTVAFETNDYNVMTFAVNYHQIYGTTSRFTFDTAIWRHTGRDVIVRFIYPEPEPGIVAEPTFVMDVVFAR